MANETQTARYERGVTAALLKPRRDEPDKVKPVAKGTHKVPSDGYKLGMLRAADA